MTGIDLEYTSTIETGSSCGRTTTECCKKTWTKRRTSPGLQRPDKQREHLAEASSAAAPQLTFCQPGVGRPDEERLASRSRQKRRPPLQQAN